jgi:hypothetical protein
MTKILKSEVPGIPDLTLAVVDVRDVALAHYLALRESKANG